ncbi:MAG: hypothetical protein KIT16_22740 [Rhodospirillaceae bacterium]|nr:hypothetical protein [Rhodospirillaceae bacterium]
MDMAAPEAPPKEPAIAGPRDSAAAIAAAARETRANVRYAGGVMAVAFALMLVFNSSGLKSYARDLPDGWVADTLIVQADRWHALMQAIGPAKFRPAIHELLEALRNADW